jgi:cytochrome P450
MDGGTTMVRQSPVVKSSAGATALILGGTMVPTPDDYLIELMKSQYIAPTHPGRDITYVAVTAPAQVWPLTGYFRLLGRMFGNPGIWGPGGAAFPDQPWWKLSGLFDLTFDRSVQVGLAALEQAMAEHGGDHLVINGFPQGSVIANLEKRKLAERYPPGTAAPDIDFVLIADANRPNGGLFARFPGLHLPVVNISFTGPAPTDTQFDTVEITRQYEWDGDFPLYPLNPVALLNSVMSIIYLHYHAFDVSLAPDASTSPAFQGAHGDTSYYFFETAELPLFGPLRTLGVPEWVIDVFQPFFRVLVELGYDRSIPPWQPTPARLMPRLDIREVAAQLVEAIREGRDNYARARARGGSPARPATGAAPVTRLSTWAMTREAISVGFGAGDGFLGRCRGHDITRFRCAGRQFVTISHPDYVDHVLHEARLKYVKSIEYEPARASAGINLLTDEGDSWAAHRAAVNPTFARRQLSASVDLMIDPIADVTDALPAGARVDMHQTMVDATLRVIANSLFSRDFGPLVQSMNDLSTRGLRHADRLQRLGLWGLMPRAAYGALHRLVSSGLRLPPPIREMQNITLTLDRAINSLIDERLVHPTDSADLLNVLLRADGGTWPRQRIRDEALIFLLAGHETTASAMSWFWYQMALHTEARDRMLAEVDDVLGTRRPTAADLDSLPWTTACLQESQRRRPSHWIARLAIEDDVIGGHRIRRGTTVIIPIHHIHHDPRWWPDPEAFDPGRFLGDTKDRPSSTYLPFGVGRRVCIGQSFALLEMLLIAAIMSQRFTFDLASGDPVEFEATVTVRPKDGAYLIARSRS